MSFYASLLQRIRKHCARALCCCFAPFEKGGHGGFAFDLEQPEQVPLDSPFSKGEAELRAPERGLVAS